MNVNVKKLVPWNWFKDEEKSEISSVPVVSSQTGQHISPLMELHREIDRLFDQAFGRSGFGNLGWPGSLINGHSENALWFKPDVDIAATDTSYTVSVEIPGVEEDNVKLELADNVLTIMGEKRHETENKDRDFYRVERSYGAFRRVLTLPEDADIDAIEANFTKGVLTITMPRKATANRKHRVIDIKKAA